MRTSVSSGSPLEPRIGFSRAVRIGSFLAVAGTAPIAADGSVAAPDDLYGQTRRCLEIVAEAIADAGLTLDSVIRTRIMLTDISRWEEAARAHGEMFADVMPACTFVEVKGFIHSEWLVEVEADCVADTEASVATWRRQGGQDSSLSTWLLPPRVGVEAVFLTGRCFLKHRHAVLSRGYAEADIRQALVGKGFIAGLIGLSVNF